MNKILQLACLRASHILMTTNYPHNNFKAGRRNYAVFHVGTATLLRVSDVMRLKQTDIFNPDVSIKQNTFIHDRKTGKSNTLYLKPVQTELLL